MLKIHRISILLFVGLLYVAIVCSQEMAIRNNLLYDATITPNLGIEMRINPAWTTLRENKPQHAGGGKTWNHLKENILADQRNLRAVMEMRLKT